MLERSDYVPITVQMFLTTGLNIAFYTSVDFIPIGTAACATR